MNKIRKTNFKELSRLQQSIIYEYNSIIYCENLENSLRHIDIQKVYEEKIINKYINNLNDRSKKQINTYIEEHRRY